MEGKLFMSINIFIGYEMINVEFINTVFSSKVQALRTQLKNEFNIEMPLIEIKDNPQLSKREIVLEIDGNIKWTHDFADNKDFDIIFDTVLDNLRKTQLPD